MPRSPTTGLLLILGSIGILAGLFLMPDLGETDESAMSAVADEAEAFRTAHTALGGGALAVLLAVTWEIGALGRRPRPYWHAGFWGILGASCLVLGAASGVAIQTVVGDAEAGEMEAFSESYGLISDMAGAWVFLLWSLAGIAVAAATQTVRGMPAPVAWIGAMVLLASSAFLAADMWWDLDGADVAWYGLWFAAAWSIWYGVARMVKPFRVEPVVYAEPA